VVVNKITSYLGLANKGRKVHVGENLVKKIEKNKIHLILFASDHISQSQSKIKLKAEAKNIPMFENLTASELANALNYEKLSAVGLSDVHLAKQIIKILKEEKNGTKKSKTED
jgi:ribosomal protein L7Ae-like RNA K-turn-binding protein